MRSLAGIQVNAVIECKGCGRIILQKRIFKYRNVNTQTVNQREILFYSPFILNKESEFQILRSDERKWSIGWQCIRQIIPGCFDRGIGSGCIKGAYTVKTIYSLISRRESI